MPSQQNSPHGSFPMLLPTTHFRQTSYHPDLTFFSPPLLAGSLLRQEIMLAMPLLPQPSNILQAHTLKPADILSQLNKGPHL